MTSNRKQQIEEYLEGVRESEEYRDPDLKNIIDENADRLLELAGKEDAGDDSVLAEITEILQNIDSVLTGVHEQVVKVMAEEKANSVLKQTELFKNLTADYSVMGYTLNQYEISTKGMPSLEQVKKGLTPEVIAKASMLAQPTLILIPPTTRESKIKAIDRHHSVGHTYASWTDEFIDDDLWNGGRTETASKWRVAIVDGAPDFEQDPDIPVDNRDAFRKILFLVEKYKKAGMDVINDADTYLTLMMKSLVEGKPVDMRTKTILNGKNLNSISPVAIGYSIETKTGLIGVNRMDQFQIKLERPAFFVLPGTSGRLRRLVNVDVTANESENEESAHMLTPVQKEKLLKTLKKRIPADLALIGSPIRDPEFLLYKIEADPEKLWSLSEMERTGGEPNVVAYDKDTKEFIFMDCSAESPVGRRNCVFDREAEEEVKKKGGTCSGNAVDMAKEMGIELLTEEQWRGMQKFGGFDTHSDETGFRGSLRV